MNKQKELADWLIRECEKRNLSWTEASRRAGVAPNTISQIVNGTPAGIKRLRALAEYFSVPVMYFQQLAGLVPISPNTLDPALEAVADQLISIYYDLKQLDPDSAERLQRIAVLQAEMVLAAARNQSNSETVSQRESEHTH